MPLLKLSNHTTNLSEHQILIHPHRKGKKQTDKHTLVKILYPCLAVGEDHQGMGQKKLNRLNHQNITFPQLEECATAGNDFMPDSSVTVPRQH